MPVDPIAFRNCFDLLTVSQERSWTQILMAKPEQLGVILEAIQNLNAGKMLLAGA